jgi:hypothetical protein
MDIENFPQRMKEAYPKMLGGKYGGFAVGPGWYPLLESLLATIQSHIDHNNQRREHLLEKNEFNQDIPDEIHQVIVTQVKEKFGGLRFYYEGGDDFIHGAVWLAESLSTSLCEECGAPGSRRGNGWVTTLCDHHYNEREQKKLLKEGYEQ